MGILHTTSKTLLIVAITVAPVIADENPFSTATSDGTTKSTSVWDQKSQPAKRTAGHSPSTSTKKQMFFSASGDKATAAEDAAAPAPRRQRMTVTADLQADETAAAETADAPRSTAHSVTENAAGDIEFTPAIFEADDETSTSVRTVAAEEDDVFVEVEPQDESAELDFDAAFSEETEDAGFSVEPDTGFDEVPTPEFDFNVDQVEPAEIGAPARELFDSPAPATETAAVVPNTDSDGLPSEHTGAQRPAVEVHWVSHDSFNIGQESRCSLVVTNTGGSLVRNVTVEAAIPSGLKVISAAPRPQTGSSRWMIGDLQAGQTEEVEMVMVPTQRGDVALNAFVRFTGHSTSVFAVQEPMLKMAVQGPETVTVGEQGGYMVRVENPGTGTAHNVVIEAQIPAGLEHRSGPSPRIHVGTLNPGESRQARLNLTALEGGEQTLTVSASADGGLIDEARTLVTIAKPSLDVVITGPETIASGESSDYEVTVTNTGNIPSINVRAKYRMPENARFVRADRGGVHHKAERLIDWFVGTIQPGESASYRVTLAAEGTGTALHRAGVVSEHTTVQLVSHSTEVQETPELYLDVSAAEPAPAPGDETVLRIIVQNDGGADADKVGLSCELPSGLEFVAANGPTEFLAENGVVIFRSLDQVKAGSDATYLIKARCVRSGEHRVRVRVGSPSLSDPVIGEGTVKTTSDR